MLHQFSRTELVIGPEGLETLKGKTVCVLGMGGVGSFAVEALARSGVGRLILIDKDDVDITNINRQIPALLTTIGRSKTDVMEERIQMINTDCEVVNLKMFFTEETKDQLFEHSFDYVIDAIDTLSAKILLIEECVKRKIPIVSSMGAANKIDPTQFYVTDISKTKIDPIAKVIRRELRKRGIYKGVKVVISEEPPRPPRIDVTEQIVPQHVKEGIGPRKAKNPPASIAYVPPVAGFILASVAIRDLVNLY